MGQDGHDRGIKVVARGTKNLLSGGAQVYVDAVQWSAAEGRSGFGEGEGPSETQRVVFGYVGRKDLVDSKGNTWRPANEFVMRLGTLADLIPKAYWTAPRPEPISGTPDPELYRYGIFGRDFTMQ